MFLSGLPPLTMHNAQALLRAESAHLHVVRQSTLRDAAEHPQEGPQESTTKADGVQAREARRTAIQEAVTALRPDHRHALPNLRNDPGRPTTEAADIHQDRAVRRLIPAVLPLPDQAARVLIPTAVAIRRAPAAPALLIRVAVRALTPVRAVPRVAAVHPPVARAAAEGGSR